MLDNTAARPAIRAAVVLILAFGSVSASKRGVSNYMPAVALSQTDKLKGLSSAAIDTELTTSIPPLKDDDTVFSLYELPESFTNKLPAGVTPSVVVSIGCHSSTVTSMVTCEDSSNDFLTGFQSAVSVPTKPPSATFYPEGPAICCTPAVVLSNGDAWEISRCNCVWTSEGDTGCSGDQLVQGYADARHGVDRAAVPVAPTRCCEACLGERIHPMDRCETLSFCNQNGVCMMGACDCNEGWGGADCSRQLRGSGWLPQWVQYILMAASVIMSTVAWAVVHKIMTDWTERRRIAAEEANAALDPLLVQEGSVGEEDTDEEYSDEESESRACATSPNSVASAPVPGATLTGRSPGPAPGLLSLQQMSASQRDEIVAALTQVTNSPQTSPSPAQQTEMVPARQSRAATPPPQASTAPAKSDGKDVKGEEEEEEPMDPELAAYLANKFDERKSPLAGIKCAICCDKPVQVALVPCGHSNLCRRCARRLKECPFCRKDIVRRQRLYIAD